MQLSDLSNEVVILFVAALLVLVMRWVFRPSRPRSARLIDATDARELGLLHVVATLSRAEAHARRAALEAAGIRSSLSRRRDGRADLLVFQSDVDRARAFLDAD